MLADAAKPELPPIDPDADPEKQLARDVARLQDGDPSRADGESDSVRCSCQDDKLCGNFSAFKSLY